MDFAVFDFECKGQLASGVLLFTKQFPEAVDWEGGSKRGRGRRAVGGSLLFSHIDSAPC